MSWKAFSLLLLLLLLHAHGVLQGGQQQGVVCKTAGTLQLHQLLRL